MAGLMDDYEKAYLLRSAVATTSEVHLASHRRLLHHESSTLHVLPGQAHVLTEQSPQPAPNSYGMTRIWNSKHTRTTPVICVWGFTLQRISIDANLIGASRQALFRVR